MFLHLLKKLLLKSLSIMLFNNLNISNFLDSTYIFFPHHSLFYQMMNLNNASFSILLWPPGISVLHFILSPSTYFDSKVPGTTIYPFPLFLYMVFSSLLMVLLKVEIVKSDEETSFSMILCKQLSFTELLYTLKTVLRTLFTCNLSLILIATVSEVLFCHPDEEKQGFERLGTFQVHRAQSYFV